MRAARENKKQTNPLDLIQPRPTLPDALEYQPMLEIQEDAYIVLFVCPT
jgi:hypothetical protein